MPPGPRIAIVPKVTVKQTLTPGLVQMVNILAMNKLELQEAITQELLENPLLDEAQEDAPPTLEELVKLEQEVEAERRNEQAGEIIPRAAGEETGESGIGGNAEFDPTATADGAAQIAGEIAGTEAGREAANEAANEAATEAANEAAGEAGKDSFDEIDYGDFFKDYLDPGYQRPEREDAERPSFDNFLSAPTTLTDHLRWQLSVESFADQPQAAELRAACEAIIGNLDEDGYLTAENEHGRRPLRVDEIAESEGMLEEVVHDALDIVQHFDPPGVAARDLRECLLIQLFQLPSVQILAITLVSEHLAALQNPRHQELARMLNVSTAEIEHALKEIRKLDPYPGRRYNPSNTRLIEPDVAFVKGRVERCHVCGSESCRNQYQIVMNDDGMPSLSLNHQYREMKWGREQREAGRYVKERYASAIQFLRNLEQRKQTIARVCHAIVERQGDFLDFGMDFLKPMMIKEVAEEIGVHPSTVSRAVANKYVHTAQGVYELRFFFTEGVQGTRGGETSLLILKRRVKKLIEGEDPSKPLTDDQITAILKEQGIEVTRRTVAKYREDMRIPSTHQRRVRPS
ncbi:MAG TPA: RNA polymerase factor sigma-54 [Terriglobales bacterium]|nr:RNA polymerase factor sigma-54 [Terriglobales bacterium]